MAGPLLLHPPTALEYFASLVAEDDGLPLLEAAVSIAHDDHPGLDAEAVLAEVDGLAERLRARLPADSAQMQRLRLLNHFFFQELGFAGNVNDYYAAGNSYLHTVLETRRGIPITLAILYVEIASQVGLVASGISFPGHFLVRLRMPRGDVVIDPFTGQSMSQEALDDLLVPYRQGQALALGQAKDAADRIPLGLFLQPAPPRDILSRMLRNLKAIHRDAEDWLRLSKVLDRLVVLLPEAWEERRDRGLAAARLGAVDSAAADLAMYLERAPHAPDRIVIAERLVELGHGDASRLH